MILQESADAIRINQYKYTNNQWNVKTIIRIENLVNIDDCKRIADNQYQS